MYLYLFHRKEPASDHLVALLVEEYLTFMKSRPGYVIDSGSKVRTILKSYVSDLPL